jgi:hypothetical protein
MSRCELTLTLRQWHQLAQELFDAGDTVLSKDAAAEAVAREPINEAARRIIATIALLEKFG